MRITFNGAAQSLTFDGSGINQLLFNSTITNNLGGMLRFTDEMRIAASGFTFTGSGPLLLDGGVSLTGSSGISLTFANMGGGVINNGINLSVDGAAHTLTLRTISSSSLVVNGPITDGATGGGLTLTGLIAIHGTNAYSGGTSISGGQITLGNSAALGTGPITMTAGTLITPFSGTLSNNLNPNGTVTLSNGGSAQSLTFDGSGINSVSVFTTVSNSLGGMLTFADEFRIASIGLTFTGNSPITLSGGLSLTGPATTALSFYAGGNVINSGINLSADGAAHTLTLRTTGSNSLVVNGPITDGATGGALTLTGMIALNGTNAYSGGTTINSGQITIANPTSFGTGLLTTMTGTIITQFSGTLANNLNSNGAFTFSNNGSAQSLTFDGLGLNLASVSSTIVNNLGGSLTFADEFRIAASAVTFTGTSLITLDGGVSLTGTTGISLTFNSAGGGVINNGVNLSADGAGHVLTMRAPTTPGLYVVNGAIVDGAAASGINIGTGAVTLNGANTFSGLSTLGGASLIAGNDGALGNAPWSVVSGTLQADSNPRTLANGLTLFGSLSIGGTASLTLDGNITLSGANRQISFTNTTSPTTLNGTIVLGESGSGRTLTLGGAAGATVLLNGTITGGGSGGAGGSVYYSNGAYSVAGTNTYSGGTTVASGTITIDNAAAFGTGPITFSSGTLRAGAGAITLANDVNLSGTLTLSGSQVLTLSGTITASTTRSIIANGSGGSVLNNLNLNASPTTFALTLGGGGPLTVAGTIAQLSATNVNLVISNTGGVTLAGVNAYGGFTTLGTGSLLILAADSTATGGPVGTGTLVIGGSGARLAADSSPRTLTNGVQLNADVVFSGTQALVAGGTLTNTTTTSRIFTANNSGGTTLGSVVMQGTLANSSLMTFGGNSSLTLGPISVGTATLGSVNITNSSSGGVTFVGDNTYTGVTTVGGNTTLYLGAGGVSGNLSGDIALTSGTGGKVVFNHSNIIVFGQAGSATSNITGAGSIEINGPLSGGVQFNSVNTFIGPTTVTQGTLRYGIANAMPIGNAMTVNAGGTIDLNGFNAGLTTLSDGQLGGGAIVNSSTTAAVLTLTQGAFGGTIGGSSGAISLAKVGSGSITLAGPNLFGGASTLNGGTLIVGHNSALGSANWAVTGTSTLQGDGAPRTIANNFTLTSGLTLAGSSYFEIDGTITNAGASRTLTISNSGGTVFGDVNISDTTTARTLTLFVAGPTTVAGTVANSLTPTGASASGLIVSLTGGNTLTFGGTLNYTLGTTINGSGTVVLAGGSSVTNHAITVGGASTLRINSGAIINNSSAAISVTGGGSLIVNGTTGAGAINVQNGSFLSGQGVIGGTVNLTNGSLSPGDGGIGTLSMKRLILNGGSLNFDLDSPLASDRIQLTGTAAPTVNAATVFNFSNLLGFGAGTYRLIGGYTGTLSSTNFALLSSPTLLGGYNLSLQNLTGGLDLVVSDSSSTNLTWVGNVGGSWDTTSANWAGGTGVFANGVYNVSFDNTSATQAISVAAGGVVPTAMTVDADPSHNYLFSGGPITSSGSLTKLGDGTLTFANTVTFTGGAIVSAGTLQIGDGTGNGVFRGNIVDNSVVSFNRAGSYTFSNNISGTGSVSLDGPGVITLSAANSYGGYTTLANGQLKLANNSALGASTLVVAGGTIIPDATARTIANNITLNSDLTLTGNGGSLTLSGVINGPSGLIVGSGSLYQLFGANTFSGASTLAPGGSINLGINSALGASTLNVDGGILQSNSSTRTLTNGIVLRGDLTTSGIGFTLNGTGILNTGGSHTLTVNSTSTLVVANLVLSDQATPLGLIIAGTGGATFNNVSATGGAISSTVWITNTSSTGILFTGNNTYTGMTTVGPGATLRLGTLATSGNLAGDVANQGTLIFRRSNAFSYTGSISGNGSVVINGTGPATFSGSHSYTGVTSVNAGTLNVTGTLGNTTVTVAAGAALGGSGRLGGSADILAGGNLTGPLTIDGTLTSSGSVGPGVGTVGTLSLGALVLNGGTLNFDLAGVGASDQFVITGGAAPTVNAATNLSFTNLAGFGLGTYSLLTGYSGQLSATGFGLLSAPSILGGYNISLANNAGELDLIVSSVAAGNVAWTGAVDNVWNTTTANWTGDASTFTDVFTNVTFSTNTSVTSILVDGAGVRPNNMTVTTDATHNYLFSGGTISSSGALTKSGTGSLTFANDVAFSGGATIFAGTLQVGAGGTNGSFTGDVVNRGQLLFNRTDTQTFNGNLSGTGGVTVTGGGAVLFTGNSSSFSGTTTVANGTLLVQGGNYGTTAANYFVGTTALGGTLTVAGGGIAPARTPTSASRRTASVQRRSPAPARSCCYPPVSMSATPATEP